MRKTKLTSQAIAAFLIAATMSCGDSAEFDAGDPPADPAADLCQVSFDTTNGLARCWLSLQASSADFATVIQQVNAQIDQQMIDLPQVTTTTPMLIEAWGGNGGNVSGGYPGGPGGYAQTAMTAELYEAAHGTSTFYYYVGSVGFGTGTRECGASGGAASVVATQDLTATASAAVNTILVAGGGGGGVGWNQKGLCGVSKNAFGGAAGGRPAIATLLAEGSANGGTIPEQIPEVGTKGGPWGGVRGVGGGRGCDMCGNDNATNGGSGFGGRSGPGGNGPGCSGGAAVGWLNTAAAILAGGVGGNGASDSKSCTSGGGGGGGGWGGGGGGGHGNAGNSLPLPGAGGASYAAMAMAVVLPAPRTAPPSPEGISGAVQISFWAGE
ncbi:MAG: hypothetical protein AAF436_10235 [Myxococcota bacterium]